MSSMSLGGAGVYSTEHGQVLDGNAMRFAQVIADYNPYFSLEFIPEKDSTGEKPYRIVDSTPGFAKNVVRYVTHTEMQQPHKVLAEIFKGDQRHHSADSILRDMELEDAARKLLDLKRQEEAALEHEDMIVFNLTGGRDRKHFLRHGNQTIAR